MDLELRDKVLVVTGATDELGLATARSLLGEGARVLVTGRREERFLRARATISQHAGHSGRVAFLAGDNADPELPARLHAAVQERWGTARRPAGQRRRAAPGQGADDRRRHLAPGI